MTCICAHAKLVIFCVLCGKRLFHIGPIEICETYCQYDLNSDPLPPRKTLQMDHVVSTLALKEVVLSSMSTERHTGAPLRLGRRNLQQNPPDSDYSRCYVRVGLIHRATHRLFRLVYFEPLPVIRFCYHWLCFNCVRLNGFSPPDTGQLLGWNKGGTRSPFIK